MIRVMALLCLALSSFVPVGAGVPLDAVEVPLAADTDADRDKAFGEALRQVVVRRSGQRDAAHGEAIKRASRQAARYVASFRVIGPASGAREGEPPLRLSVVFDAAGVDRLLDEAGLRPWTRDRPEPLVWLAAETARGRHQLGEPAIEDLGHLLNEAVSRRGLTLRYPLFDLEDQRAVTFGDVWGGFDANLIKGSARYDAGSLLVIRLTEGADGWRAGWTLHDPPGAEALRWESRGKGAAQAIDAGVDALMDRITERHAPRAVSGAVEAVLVAVSGMVDAPSYATLMRWLRTQDAIVSMQPAALSGDTLWLTMGVRGGREGMERLAVAGAPVIPDGVVPPPPPLSGDVPPEMLALRYVP